MPNYNIADNSLKPQENFSGKEQVWDLLHRGIDGKNKGAKERRRVRKHWKLI